MAILTGKAAYSEKVLDPDEGFTLANPKDKERAKAIAKVIRIGWQKHKRNARSAIS